MMQSRKLNVRRIFIGSFLTSLEMAGVSMTVMRVVEQEVLSYLDAPTSVTIWPKSVELNADYLAKVSFPMLNQEQNNSSTCMEKLS